MQEKLRLITLCQTASIFLVRLRSTVPNLEITSVCVCVCVCVCGTISLVFKGQGLSFCKCKSLFKCT